ncbi:MAG: transglycosylase domain-containing protein [Bacteroidales bacterium]|jgi:penicillin-binding protein 1A|nr:transglycosylase domain-containing protein [Bacteroidales bacterium]
MPEAKKKNTKKKKVLVIFWGTVTGLFLLVFLLFVLIVNGKFGFMPTFEYLENPKTSIATEVYSSDGELLTTFFLNENRNPVTYKDLPPYLVNALIAREDHRFVDHSGIDGIGLIRVAVKTVLLGRRGEGGGSTITQQLAKQLFERDTTQYRWGLVRKAHMATIKFREWVIAVRLEKQYTKQEIITMYLNIVPFGYDAYGIKSAARTYFKQSVDSLRIEDAALLVGMLKAPSRYNPVRHPERALVRRNGVLSKMEENNFLNERMADSLKQLPIQLDFERLDHVAGIAPYFREYLRKTMDKKKPEKERYGNPLSYQEDSIQWAENPLFGWCSKNLKPDHTPYSLYTDGLKIYTTIDSRMQKYAEESMKQYMKETIQAEFFREKKNRRKAPFSEDVTNEQIETIMSNAIRGTARYITLRKQELSWNDIIKNFKTPCEMTIFSWDGEIDTIMSPWDSIRWHKSFLRASMMAMNPHTGEVKAYVGGIDYRHFKWDGVTVQKRQVGSTFKPFLYTLAMQDKKELTPCYRVLNVPQSFIDGDTTWQPRSSGRKEFLYQPVTLKWALATSENNITAWLLKQVSAEAVAEMARKMGVKNKIDPVPSIVLGTPELSLAEMVGAFSVYPNKGVYSEPIYVTRIEDKNGNVLQRFNSYKEEAISEHTAYLMVNLLEGVVKGGTASRLRYTYNLRTMDMGGKTGTSQRHSDGWYIGITPDLVAGVWVGGEDRGIRFDNMKIGQGANTALPIYGLFMQKVYADKSIGLTQEPFERPDGFNVDLNCDVDKEFGGNIDYDESML